MPFDWKISHPFFILFCLCLHFAQCLETCVQFLFKLYEFECKPTWGGTHHFDIQHCIFSTAEENANGLCLLCYKREVFCLRTNLK